MKTKDVTHLWNEDIEKYWGLNLKLLSVIGLKVSVDSKKKMKENSLLNKMPIYVPNALSMFAAMLQVRDTIYYIVHNNTYLATQVSSHFFSNILCISKGYQLAIAVMEIQIVLREVADLWKKNSSRGHRQEILTTATNTLIFCKCFVLVNLGGIFSFSLSPLQNVLSEYNRNTTNYTYIYSQRALILRYPFSIQNSIVYLLVILEEEFLILCCGLFWVTCDTLFAQLTTHISLQLQILKDDINDLINCENTERRLKGNFTTLVKRHCHLLRICEQVEHIFSPVILTTVLSSSINICLNVFGLKETIAMNKYTEASVHTFLLINIFFQIVFFCTFAEALTEQTSSIAYAIYNSNWTEKDPKFKIYIQMLVIRSQSPFYCTGYGFFRIGHQRLTMVINTGFSYYMMLKTAGNK